VKKLLISVLLLACCTVRAQYSQQTLNDLLMAAQGAYSGGSTGAPPSYIYPTNGQSLAGLYAVNELDSTRHGAVRDWITYSTNGGGSYWVNTLGGFAGTSNGVWFDGAFMNGATQLTFAFWFWHTTGDEITYFARFETGTKRMGIDLVDIRAVYPTLADDSGNLAQKAQSGVAYGTWTHLAMIWDAAATRWEVYINAVRGSDTITYGSFVSAPLFTSTNSIKLPQAWDGGAQNCRVRDVFFSSKAISASALTNLYLHTSEATYDSAWWTNFPDGNIAVSGRRYLESP